MPQDQSQPNSVGYNLSAQIFAAFRTTYGPITAVIGIILALLTWQFDRNSTVKLWILIVLITFIGPIFFALINLIFSLNKHAETLSTELKNKDSGKLVRGDKNSVGGIESVLIFKYHIFFAKDIHVEFYHTRDDLFEVRIGEGYINLIQNNGLVQAVVTRYLEGTDQIWNSIWSNNTKTLDSTIAKPVSRYIKSSSGQFSNRPPLR